MFTAAKTNYRSFRVVDTKFGDGFVYFNINSKSNFRAEEKLIPPLAVLHYEKRISQFTFGKITFKYRCKYIKKKKLLRTGLNSQKIINKTKYESIHYFGLNKI